MLGAASKKGCLGGSTDTLKVCDTNWETLVLVDRLRVGRPALEDGVGLLPETDWLMLKSLVVLIVIDVLIVSATLLVAEPLMLKLSVMLEDSVAEA